MTEASVRFGNSEMEEETISQGEQSPTLSENETESRRTGNSMAAKSPKKGKVSKTSRRRTSKTSKKAELTSLEDKMEEKMRSSIESRFASFEDKILGLIAKGQSSNTSGVCSPSLVSTNTRIVSPSGRLITVSAANNYTLGVSSVSRNSIPIQSSLDEELLNPLRQNQQQTEEITHTRQDDELSIQPGQLERRDLEVDSSISDSEMAQSQIMTGEEKLDTRFSRYKSREASDEPQNVLKQIFGDDACTGNTNSNAGLILDESQSDILKQSWRIAKPDKLTAYKDSYKVAFPIHEKSEDLICVPSLDDIVETFLMKRFSNKACFKKQKNLQTSHLKEIEKLAYQGQVAAKMGISIVVYLQQAVRVLLEELKTENPNIDLAIQTVRDVFAMSTKSLDQLGRSGAHLHMIRRKAAIVDMGLENVKDVANQANSLPLTGDGVLGSSFEAKLKDRKEKNKEAKDLVPELEPKKYPSKRKSSNYSYENKQRRYNDNSKNFNNRSYSGDYRSPLRRLYNNNNRSGYNYRSSGQAKKSAVSSFRGKSRK